MKSSLPDGAKSRRGGSTIISLLLLAVVAAGGWHFRNEIKGFFTGEEDSGLRTPIAGNEVELAEKYVKLLFTSAQFSFIHHNQHRMASSITEFGDGFTMGSTGCLNYLGIWAARLDRPESDIPPVDEQTQDEKDALARPYRYAVLPVKDLNGEELDDRTTFVLAVPNKGKRPLLAMLAGPIRSDPRDFHSSYKVHRINDNETIDRLTELAKSGQPFTKAEMRFLEDD